MTTVLDKINNEKMNPQAFAHLSADMQGVVLHSLSEEYRNEEIMAKLDLSEKELKDYCTKYGIKYQFRLMTRRLDGERTLIPGELNEWLQKGKMNFEEFMTFDRSSQRKLIYGFIEGNGVFSKTIRNVFGVKFQNFFQSLYQEEKANHVEKPSKKASKESSKEKEVVALAEQQLEVKSEDHTTVTLPKPQWLHTEEIPTEEELHAYLTTPSESNSNDLTHLSDEWDSPFGTEKAYLIQMKSQKATKRQVKMKLRHLLDEIEELEEGTLLSLDFKMTEHMPKK